jgi:hypothetical protein
MSMFQPRNRINLLLDLTLALFILAPVVAEEEEEEEDLHLEALKAPVAVEEEVVVVVEEETVVGHQQRFKFLTTELALLLVEVAKQSKCFRTELEQGFRCPKKAPTAFALSRYQHHQATRSNMPIERSNYSYPKNLESHQPVLLVEEAVEEQEVEEEEVVVEPHGDDLIEDLVVVEEEEEDLIKR